MSDNYGGGLGGLGERSAASGDGRPAANDLMVATQATSVSTQINVGAVASAALARMTR